MNPFRTPSRASSVEKAATSPEAVARSRSQPHLADLESQRDSDLEAEEGRLVALLAELEEDKRSRGLALIRREADLSGAAAAEGRGAAMHGTGFVVVVVGDLLAVLPLSARFAGSDWSSFASDGVLPLTSTLFMTATVTLTLGCLGHWLHERLPGTSPPAASQQSASTLAFERGLLVLMYGASTLGLGKVRLDLEASGASLVLGPSDSGGLTALVFSGFIGLAPLVGVFLFKAGKAAGARARSLRAELQTVRAERRGLAELEENASARLEVVRAERREIRAAFDRAFRGDAVVEPREPENRATRPPPLEWTSESTALVINTVVLFTLVAIAFTLLGCSGPQPATLEILVDTSPGNIEDGRPRQDDVLGAAWSAFAQETRLPPGSLVRVALVGEGIAGTQVLEMAAPDSWGTGAAVLERKRRFVHDVDEALGALRFQTSRQSAVFSGIWSVGRRLQQSAEGPRWLVVVSDARDHRQSSSERTGWWFARKIPGPADVVDELRSTSELPDLAGADVFFCGVHAGPMGGEAWSAAKDAQLREVLTALGTAAGARSLTVRENCATNTFNPTRQ